MRSGSRSLNLANAVSVVVYEAWQQQGFAGHEPRARPPLAIEALAEAHPPPS